MKKSFLGCECFGLIFVVIAWMIRLGCPSGHWTTYAAVADGVRSGGADIVIVVVVGHAHVLLLDQLLGTLDLVQSNALG